MSWFGDLMLGTKPQYGYSDAQQGVIDYGMNYANQDHYDPQYGRDVRQSKRYEHGDDRGGKLTRFMQPMQQQLEQNRESAVQEYNTSMNSGFNAGGSALAAGGAAHIRMGMNRDIGNTLGGMYVQRGEQLHDRVHQGYMDSEGLKLQGAGLAGSVASRPEDETRQGSGLLGQIIKGGINYGTGFLPKPPV